MRNKLKNNRYVYKIKTTSIFEEFLYISKKIIRKVFVNKCNKQLTVLLSKKELKKIDPNIKFGDDLFVELSIFKNKKKGVK